MKHYAIVAIIAFGGLLVVGLDSGPARTVAVALLVVAAISLGMILESEPITPRKTDEQED